MKKIPTVFKRDEKTRQVVNEITPGCEWVLAGEGRATIKYDGTSCLVKGGTLYKRRVLRLPKRLARQYLDKGIVPNMGEYDIPEGWFPASDPDPGTLQWPGWSALDNDDPADRWHLEALGALGTLPEDGTYELVGPKVQGNPYGIDNHRLWKHGAGELDAQAPREYDALREWLANVFAEGIVWHHPDGRMAKIKRRDFGYDWPFEVTP